MLSDPRAECPRSHPTADAAAVCRMPILVMPPTSNMRPRVAVAVHLSACCVRACRRRRPGAAGAAGLRRTTETGDVLHRAFHGARVVSCEMLSLPGFLTLHSNISADATPRTRIPTPRSETPGAAGASGQPQRRAGPRSRRHPICEELDDRGQLEALRYREGRLALAVLNLG